MFNNKTKNTFWVAVISSFSSGFITHLFALTNILHNYDDIASLPGGYGTGTSSGRWFLQLIGQFFLDSGLSYNLTLINGLIFLLFVSLSAGILVHTLCITKRASAILIGILFSVFPSASSTLFFRFSATYYGIAIFISILAPFLVKQYRYGFICSVFLIAFSLGIYQAYVPMTIGIFVLLLIQDILNRDNTVLAVIRKGLFYCAVLLLGYVLYYIITKFASSLTGDSLSNYQGIQNMGQIALADLPKLIYKAFKDVCLLPLQDYCGIAYRQIIQYTYLLLAIVSFFLLIYVLITRLKSIKEGIVLFLLLLVFPIAINFIEIMVPEGWVYTLMVYPLVLLPCLPLVLLEYTSGTESFIKSFPSLLSKSICAITLLLVSLYIYYANVNYSAMYYENRQVENYLSSMVTQVRMTEGFRTDMEWILIGDITDPLLGSMWAEETAYGGNSYALHLLNSFSFSDWIENYVGYNVPFASEASISAFNAMEEVKQMTCWPNHGSIQIIQDSVVIKFQNIP